jgi:hypothetical protein
MVSVTRNVSKTAQIQLRKHFVGEMLCFSVKSEKNRFLRRVVEG